MYPPGHPSVQETMDKAVRSFDMVLGDHEQLTVMVTRDSLICNDEKISASSTELTDLAMLLHELDIAAVVFHTGLTVDDLYAVLAILTQARRKKVSGSQLTDMLSTQASEKIQLHPIEYDALCFSKGTKEDRRDEPLSDEFWTKLIRLLTDPSAKAVDQESSGALQQLG